MYDFERAVRIVYTSDHAFMREFIGTQPLAAGQPKLFW
jgi:hypothetical protein